MSSLQAERKPQNGKALEPPSKRMKIHDESEEDDEKEATEVSRNKDGEAFIDLGLKKRLTIRKWKGKVLIDIREFYEGKNGEMLPGKKGISLNTDQFKVIEDTIKNGMIDRVIKEES